MDDETTTETPDGEDPVQVVARALYGHARGLYGDALAAAWAKASIGTQLPYTDRAVAVVDALTD